MFIKSVSRILGSVFSRLSLQRLVLKLNIDNRLNTMAHSTFLLAIVAVAAACIANARELTDTPDLRLHEIGLSSEHLEQITDYLQQEVDAGRIAGAVAAVSRHGRVGYLQAVGDSDVESQRKMQTDSLFRIASMTKAITSAAVLSLVEDGALSLDDPLSLHLPNFANPSVLQSIDGDSTATVAAEREPTIRDLLTHRSGLVYGWFGPEKLDAIYSRNQIPNLFEPTNETMGDRVNRIASVPLKFQPASGWDYGVSTDVLGRVVEVASGMTLEHFFRERFFRPLQMHDTHFYVPEEKQSRLAGLYTTDSNMHLKPVTNLPVQAAFLRFSADYCTKPGTFYSGGGGLVSSATDYMRFLHMLLRGGELDGARVLKRETVALMTSNQIGNMTIPFTGHGDGFGFGFGVVTDRGFGSDEFSVGSYSWGGIFNTYFWVDPQEQLIGVLMTQVFPNDHLQVRENFRKLTYAALDDSGFEQVYDYQPGVEHANPHFNARQLRVNGAEVSTHPEFADRTEPRSSGMARIRVDEDLRSVRRVDLETEIWGGHPGTVNKRVTINGRSTHLFPEVGSAQQHCTHQSAAFNLRPIDLVNGYNSLQFACDTGDTFWGHYIVDEAKLRIGLHRDDPRLEQLGLKEFVATVHAQPMVGDTKGYSLELEVADAHRSRIASVDFQVRYCGYDDDGNGFRADWHALDGSTFATGMLPAQQGIEARALVGFREAENLRFRTQPTKNLVIVPRDDEAVQFFPSSDLPQPFWSRDDKIKECTIRLDVEPTDIVAAELHVVAWTGGPGEVNDYFTLNGKHYAIAEGDKHETLYSRVSVDPAILRRGENKIVLRSDTKHHGIEIMLPGPALLVRHKVATNNQVSVTVDSARDPSADDIDCFRIKTPTATYYLDKTGAGLSSMIDKDGNDWLGFHPQPGTGAAGEYRGFPNAVYKEAGSYFHARNSGTGTCITKIEEASSDRVIISAVADNGLWSAQYKFTPSSCTFTMTGMPPDHRYWVLYEGTPGGSYDDSDWWMTATDDQKHALTETFDGDLPGGGETGEWIAFGDKSQPRMLVLTHAEDDSHPDRFYQMEKKMTVFGFGRAGMQKYLSSVPQSFSIGFVESTQAAAAMQFAGNHQRLRENTQSANLSEFEQYALTHTGDAKAGAKLFHSLRTRCSACHRVDNEGSQVGPDLSSIGGKLDRPHLIDSLLYPSRQIGYGYETTTVRTADGTVINGIAKESDDSHIALLNSEAQMVRIAKADIEESRVSKVSMMPTGLTELLSQQEFTDLVTYLESLGPGNGKFGSGVSGPVQLPSGFQLTTVATGLSGAVAMEVAPDGRVFICEQGGTLRVVKDDKLLEEPFVQIPVEMNWERGLIGVTVAPDFPADPHVYVVYVSDQPFTHHRISRFRASGNVAVSNSEEVLLRGDDQSKFGGNVPAGHQGGGIHFGPDGKLYVGLGEQTAGTPSQNMEALQGKILRLNANGSIPDDNPFLNETSGKYQSIWAKGCRNPFTFAFSQTGDMLINDVGGKFEEINRGTAGANYGWPGVDHGPTEKVGITGPIHYYPQSSINGGDFCPSQSSWPTMYHGKYFFADFVHGWVKLIDPLHPQMSQTFLSGIRRPVDLRFAPDGSLYVLLRNAWVVDDNFIGGTGALVRISKQ